MVIKRKEAGRRGVGTVARAPTGTWHRSRLWVPCMQRNSYQVLFLLDHCVCLTTTPPRG